MVLAIESLVRLDAQVTITLLRRCIRHARTADNMLRIAGTTRRHSCGDGTAAGAAATDLR